MRRALIAGGLAVALIAFAVILGRSGSVFDPGAGVRRAVVASAVAIAVTLLVKGRLRDVALMATSLCVGFAALEAIALYREAPQPKWTDSGLRQPRAFVGFGPTHAGAYETRKIAPDGHVIFDVVNTIGDDLLRVTKAPKGDGAVAFFGDSFAFGAGIEDKDTITQAFADLTGQSVPVPNVSFSAWSPAQNLATLQHGLNDDELRHPRRFVLMTAAWHMDRTACKADFVRGTPRYRLKDGKLVQDGACFEPGQLHQFLIGFALYRSVLEPQLAKLTKADFETYYAIVDAFVRLAKEKYGADTTIVALPYAKGYLEQFGSSEKDYLAGLASSGADVVVDRLPFEPNDKGNNPYLLPGDKHPTGLANRVLAKQLLDHFREKWPDLLPKTAAALP